MRNFISAGRKIVAFGLNFADHAKELNNAIPKVPLFFLKPTSSYIQAPNPIEIPKDCEVHYEVELGVVISKEGRDINSKEAYEHIAGYALAIDMTARNMQNDARGKGLPWSACKGFDTFTPVSDFIDKSLVKDPHNLNLWLKINSELKQNGTTNDMIFKIPELVTHVSSIMKLQPGDLILTGTPKGVGPVLPGQTILAGLETSKGELLSKIQIPAILRSGNFVYHEP